MGGRARRAWRPTAAQVAQLRADLGLSLTEFAARMGVSRRTACYWEQGDRDREVAMTSRLAIRRFRRFTRETEHARITA